jgi:BRCT domain type II-containing protein
MMSTDQDNKRETGARKYPAVSADTTSETSQEAALPKQKKTYGLTESVEDTEETTGHSDGQNPSRATPSPATEKISGAGPALAEHSKDAKAPKGGRQPGAYVKK